MEFREDTAKQLIEKYNLDENTIRVWHSRGHIPNKYFKEDFKIAEEIVNEADLQSLKDFERIAKYGKINIQSFCRLTSVNPIKVRDFLLKKGTLNKDELIALKKGINILKIEAKKILFEINKTQVSVSKVLAEKIKGFLLRNEFHLFVLFSRNKQISSKFESWTNGRRDFPEECLEELKQVLVVFITEMYI